MQPTRRAPWMGIANRFSHIEPSSYSESFGEFRRVGHEALTLTPLIIGHAPEPREEPFEILGMHMLAQSLTPHS